MDIKGYSGSISEWSGDALAVFLNEEDLDGFRYLGEDIANEIGRRAAESSFKAKKTQPFGHAFLVEGSSMSFLWGSVRGLRLSWMTLGELPR